MRWLIGILFGAICCYLIYYFAAFGVMISAIVGTLAWTIIAKITDRMEYRQDFAYYQNIIDPIFVVGLHPDPESKKELFINLQDGLIVPCEHEKVFVTAQEIRRWMERTRNANYANGTIRVIEMKFREGENVNEKWKEYNKRILSAFYTERKEVHKKLQKADPVWYDVYAMNQEGKEYRPTIK